MDTTEAPTSQDPLRKVEEVRQRLKLDTRQGVYHLIYNGKLKAETFPAGKKVRYRVRESVLQLYILEHTIPDALPLPDSEACPS